MNHFRFLFLTIALFSVLSPLHAAQKEKLVLMPLRLAEDDRMLQGAMESALVKGLQQKYEVFSGEQVQRKAKEIFNRESVSAKKECDETRCMQDIAMAFQAELIATANITKRDDGYFLALSINNIIDNKVVQSESVPCRNCDAYEVVDKLKELAGTSASVAQPTVSASVPAAAAIPTPKIDNYNIDNNNAEDQLWKAIEQNPAIDDYNVYLTEYPKGKFVTLAKVRIKKLEDEAKALADQKEKQIWESAEKAADVDSYENYLATYPKGQYAALAQLRVRKAQEDRLWNHAKETATRTSMQEYLQKYPQGRYAAEARAKEAEYKLTPSRPTLPFEVSEDVWRVLESSEYYRNLPSPRKTKVSYQTTVQSEYTGSKSRSLPKPAPSNRSSIAESVSVGEKCAETVTETDYSSTKTSMQGFSCGIFINLGFTINGELSSRIKSIDELKGSLFPLRIGNKLTVRTQSSNIKDSKFDMSHSNACEVTGQQPASEIDSRLKGQAWKIHCSGSYKSNYDNKLNEYNNDTYYFEDAGVFFWQLGQLDHQTKKHFFPKVGSQTIMDVEGEYGSRVTTTYNSYEWKVGE